MEVVLFDVGLVDGEGAGRTGTSLRRTQSVPSDVLLLWFVEGKLVPDGGDLLLKRRQDANTQVLFSSPDRQLSSREREIHFN